MFGNSSGEFTVEKDHVCAVVVAVGAANNCRAIVEAVEHCATGYVAGVIDEPFNVRARQVTEGFEDEADIFNEYGFWTVS